MYDMVMECFGLSENIGLFRRTLLDILLCVREIDYKIISVLLLLFFTLNVLHHVG